MDEYNYDSVTGKKKKASWVLSKGKLTKEELDDYFTGGEL